MIRLIKNCHCISPDVDLIGASIELEGAFIKKIYKKGDHVPDIDSVYDAHGNMAMPGFIDIHCHGCGGFDVADGSARAIENIAKGKVKEGVTTFAPTTLSLPYERLETIMAAVSAYKKDERYAKIAGVHCEGPFINRDYLGAQNPAYQRKPDMEEVRKLNKITRISIITCAPEIEGGLTFISELRAEGIVPSCGHSAATYAQFRKAREAGLRQLTHFCNQMTGLHHREIGLVGAGLLDDDLFVEIICDRIHLCPEMVALIFKVKPIEKIMLITDSIAASGLDDGMYTIGGLDISIENKISRLVKNPDVLAGSVVPFNRAVKNAYEISGLPLKQLVKTTGFNQAQAIGLDKTGRLEPGYYADITILNDEFSPIMVFVNGEAAEL
ncbi:MAG: N-acetylglucosamine-6-phosphate deacetylase [bacterium]